jgi:hypothetical protein
MDGLLPNPHVAAATSDPDCAFPSTSTTSMDNDGDSNVLAFLAEFVPYCDTHYLLSVNVAASDFTSVPEVLTAAADGSLEPNLDVDDNPLWSKALALPKQEY